MGIKKNAVLVERRNNMYKKQLLHIIYFCMFFVLLTSGYQKCSAASAHTQRPGAQEKPAGGKKQAGGDKFTIVNGVLTNYDSDDPVAVIPSGVTAIGDYAFSKSTYLEIVIIPDSVETIGEYAFSGCNLLEEIAVPDSVSEIGQYAFSYCSALKKAKLSANLKKLSPYLFYYCTSLEDVSIVEGCEVIGEGCFGHCSQLVYLSLPMSMENIGFWSLEYCDSLKHILILQNVSKIDDNAFAFCDLAKLTIYGNKNSIAEEYAGQKKISFAPVSKYDVAIEAEKSAYVDKPPAESNEAYPAKKAVFNASGISYQIVSATSNKEKFGKVLLKKSPNKKVTSVSIPAVVAYEGFSYNITQIGANAFKKCKKLKKVTIKTTKLEKIGKNAFYGIHKNAVIKCPKNQLAKYKKYLTAKTGYKKTMKIR